MLTPTGYPPPNTAADMAHSTHSTQPALRPHRATPRAEVYIYIYYNKWRLLCHKRAYRASFCCRIQREEVNQYRIYVSRKVGP